MRRVTKTSLYQACGILVPLLTFFSPSWVSIAGVGPRWAELWLLPLALQKGPLQGALAGGCVGLVLDALNLDGSTQMPSLILVGYFWGRFGRKEEYLNKHFALGFFAWAGSLVNGFFIWVQQVFLIKGGFLYLFNAWAFHAVLATAVITGLISQLTTPLLIRVFFRGKA